MALVMAMGSFGFGDTLHFYLKSLITYRHEEFVWAYTEIKRIAHFIDLVFVYMLDVLAGWDKSNEGSLRQVACQISKLTI